MKRKIIILLICTLFVFCGPAYSQIFLLEEDITERAAGDNESFSLEIPEHNSTNDFTGYVPLGEGVFLLTCMGLAYGLRGSRYRGEERRAEARE